MLKRGIKRRPDEGSEAAQEEYAANLSNFQIAARRRESLRLKQTVSAAPGLMEKSLKDKIAVEMSLVEGTAKFIMACKNQSQVRWFKRETDRYSNRCNICSMTFNDLDLLFVDPGGREDFVNRPSPLRYAQIRA